MKKRLISLLLTLVMLVSLCPALGVSASADAQVTTVTLGSGDTVLGLCQKLGVNYYTHKNLIMTLNGFSSEAQFSKLAVGSKIVLPVSEAAASALTSGGVSTGTAPTTPVTGTTAGTGIVSGTTTSIPTGDYVSYYLVAYTIQPGETIAGIYNNWGLSYKTYSNQILKLNNLGSYNAIPAGKTLILPTTNPAVAGSAYTTVMAHVMRTGDSAYNIICGDYGLNYNAVQKQVQALNNRENLANFMVGEVLYIPVTGLVSSNTTVTPGTGSSSTNATINNSAAYNLVSQTPANGSFSLLVDGVAATTAFAGKTVEVVAAPSAGYALSAITVTKVGDANTVVTVSGNKFVMPAYSVSVSVSFTQAVVSAITVDNAANGGVSALVNGTTVTSATAGNLVTIKTIPATGFMLDNVRVTYNNYRDTVAVENGQFVMPAFPVTVTASFKEDPNYDPTKGHNIYFDAVNGSVRALVGASEVTTANKGDRVTLEVTPNANYTLQSLTVYYDNFKKTVDIEKNAFTMPDGPVTVVANITATADAAFNITTVHNADGTIGCYVGEEEVTSAKVGAKVQIIGESYKEYYNYIPTVFKTGDTSVTVAVDEEGCFVMPDFPVTVSLKFYVYHDIILDASNGTNGWFNVTAALNGMAVSRCGAGVELKVTVWGFNSKLYAPGNVILTYADGSTHTLDGASFIMPDCDVKVRVNFNPVQTLVAHSPGNANNGNGYYVLGYALNDEDDYTYSINAGEANTIVVTPEYALGYQIDNIYYTYVADGTNTLSTVYVNTHPVTGKYQFQMPKLEEGTVLDLYVSFKSIPTYDIEFVYNAENAGEKMGKAYATTSIGVVSSAVKGAKISLRAIENEGYGVDHANVLVTNKLTGAVVELNRNDYTFFMPDFPVQVYVPFKANMHSVKLALAEVPANDVLPKGVINAVVDGTKYTDSMLTAERLLPIDVKEGTVVTIINESREGFILDSTTPILVLRVNTGLPIEVRTLGNDRFSFEMPDDDVVVIAQYADDMYTIMATESVFGTYSVPAQAAYSSTEPVMVTNINPDRGYELDKILVSYIDHNGVTHMQEPLSGTGFIPAGGGIPKTEVYFEVLFKPVLNPLTISYVFNNTPNPGCNYSVDLTVDGKFVEGIKRGTFAGSDYDDVLTVDKEKGYGVATGKTVIISRQTHNMDKNFDIVNIWIELDGKAITPEFSNGQYYFTVPYVDSKLAKDLVIFVQYAKDSEDSFNLVAINATGNGDNAKAEFTVNGSASTIAKAKDAIVLTLTPEEGSALKNEVIISYMDLDDNPVRETVALTVDPSTGVGTVKFGDSASLHHISSLPKSTAVTVEYESNAKEYTLSFNSVDTKGNPLTDAGEFWVDGAAASSAPWGSMVTAFPYVAGFRPVKVEVKAGTELLVSNGNNTDGYNFEMPKANVTVHVTYEPMSYVISRVFPGDGFGTADIKVGETYFNDGDAIPQGSVVTVVPKVTEGTDSKLIAIVSDPAATMTDNGDGTYSFTMPASNTVVSVTFVKNDYNLDHHYSTESAISDYTLVIDGTDYKHGDAAKIAVGKTVTIKPEVGFDLSDIAIGYIDGDDNVVSYGPEILTLDADGNYCFALTVSPKAGEDVNLTLTFKSVITRYKLSDASGYSSDKITVSYGSVIDGEGKVAEGTLVDVALRVRYNQVFDGKITVNFTDALGNPASESFDPSFISLSSDGLWADCGISFYMPSSDATISYTLKAQDKFNVDTFDVTTDKAVYTKGDTIKATPDAAAVAGRTIVRAVAVYETELGSMYVADDTPNGSGEYELTITEIGLHSTTGLTEIERANLVEVYLEYAD